MIQEQKETLVVEGLTQMLEALSFLVDDIKGRRQFEERMESKLDALLEALAADDEEETEEPALDLSGRRVPGARDQGGAL